MNIGELGPDDLAAVARAVPGVVSILKQAIADDREVDVQVGTEGRHFIVFLVVVDGDVIVQDVTVTIDTRALDERTKLVLLHLHAQGIVRRQARLERQWAAKAAVIRARRQTGS